MAVHKWSDVRKRKLSPKQLEEADRWVENELLAMDLRAIREMLGKTQVGVAEAAEMTQAELSKIERREDHRLSTLRRIVGAMGGELEVIAKFGDKMVKLHGV